MHCAFLLVFDDVDHNTTSSSRIRFLLAPKVFDRALLGLWLCYSLPATLTNASADATHPNLRQWLVAYVVKLTMQPLMSTGV